MIPRGVRVFLEKKTKNFEFYKKKKNWHVKKQKKTSIII